MHKYYLMVVLELDLVDELVNLLEQTRLRRCVRIHGQKVYLQNPSQFKFRVKTIHKQTRQKANPKISQSTKQGAQHRNSNYRMQGSDFNKH